MSFESIGKGIMFIYDNYNGDSDLQEYIDNIDMAESDKDIKENVRKIIEVLKGRFDKNAGIIEELFKGFI